MTSSLVFDVRAVMLLQGFGSCRTGRWSRGRALQRHGFRSRQAGHAATVLQRLFRQLRCSESTLLSLPFSTVRCKALDNYDIRNIFMPHLAHLAHPAQRLAGPMPVTAASQTPVDPGAR